MKVWLVSTGDDSEYDVRGVYSSEELADLAASRLAYPNGHKELELDELPKSNQESPNLHLFSVYIEEEFDESGVAIVSSYATRVDDDGEASQLTCSVGRYRVQVHCFMWAKDKQYATKILQDKRTQLLAEERWPRAPNLRRRRDGTAMRDKDWEVLMNYEDVR